MAELHCEKVRNIIKETAKDMLFSDEVIAKLDAYFKEICETAKKKGECPSGKTEESRKKFEEDTVKACKELVSKDDKGYVGLFVKAAFDVIRQRSERDAKK